MGGPSAEREVSLASGAGCAKALRGEGFDGDVTLVCAEPVPPYQRPPLSKAYLLGDMEEERLYLRPESWYQDQNITLRLGVRVTRVTPERKTVELEAGEVLPYDQLALCTGSHPHTLPAAIGGNLVLGIGPSHQPVVEGMWGISFDKPVRHVREYLEILGPLLHEKSARFAGETLTTRADIEIDAPAPKVMVAALGPQMLKVTGRLADGTILWMTGPTTIETHTVPTIAAAAAEAGRPEPEIAAGFPVCVTDGSNEALDAARARASEEFAIYGQLPSYRAMLDREGYEGPADLAIIGPADQVGERITGLADRGVTTFAASEFGSADQRAATRELLVSLL